MKVQWSAACSGLWLSLATLPSCTTVEPAPPPTPVLRSAKVVPKPAVVAKPGPPECPVRDTVCTMDYNPMVCSSSSYDDVPQQPAAQLFAWGPNGCAGRLNLQRLACSEHLLPSKLGGVQCVPDASGGHCPVAEDHCPKVSTPAASVQAPAAKPAPALANCVAARYGVQALNAAQQLAAVGDDECHARAALQREACRRNLDPEKLAQISCQPIVAVKQPRSPGAEAIK